MRAISHIRRYGIQIFPPLTRVVGPGMIEEIRPGYVAEFVHGDVTAEELRWAEANFAPNGRTTELDEVTPTPLLGRMSGYDTESRANQLRFAEIDEIAEGQPVPGHPREKWTAGTTQRLVEEKLRSRMNMGAGDYAIVEEIPVNAPWPTYNEFKGSIADLVQRLVDDRHHLPEVLLYERQNLNRADVIAAIEDALAAQQAEGELAGVNAEDVIRA